MFDKDFDKFTSLVIVGWIVSVLLNLAMMGVGIWAIIQLVQWIQTK